VPSFDDRAKMSSEKTPLLQPASGASNSATIRAVSSNDGSARSFSGAHEAAAHEHAANVHIDDDVDDDCDPSTVADVEGALGHAVEEATGESLVLVEKSKKVRREKKEKKFETRFETFRSFFLSFFYAALCRWIWWQNN
jgi:hypothetical protein